MGNKRSVYAALGASNHSPDLEREINDFYATPPIATKGLLDMMKKHNILQDKENHIIYEPCCGLGHISDELADAGYNVIASDLIVRTYAPEKVNYLNRPIDFFDVYSNSAGKGLWTSNEHYKIEDNTSIITNPPYGKALECVEHAMSIVHDGEYVIMFLKIQFLEGIARYKFFQYYPPQYIFVCSDRMQCMSGGNFQTEKDQHGGSVCYCWYVWKAGFKGYPTIDWIKPSKLD